MVGVEASLTTAPQGFDGSSEASFAGGFKIPYIAFANWEGESRLSAEISQLFTVTGRLGYAWDRWLGYVKGGYASAKIGVDYDMAGDGKGCLFAHCSAFDFGASASSRERHHGWTLGGGLEYAFMPNVIVGLEYNYIDLGAKTHSANGEAFIDIPRHDDWKDDFHGRLRVDPDAIHTVYARLSFKFGREAAEPVPLK